MTLPDLSHLARSGARLAAGWHLLHDADRLTRLGPGEVHLDLVRGCCRHELTWVPPLRIGPLLRSRIDSALQEASLAWSDLARADLRIRYQLSEAAPSDSPMASWSGFDGPFVACRLNVCLTLTGVDGSWSGSHDGTLSWPRAWALR